MHENNMAVDVILAQHKNIPIKECLALWS